MVGACLPMKPSLATIIKWGLYFVAFVCIVFILWKVGDSIWGPRIHQQQRQIEHQADQVVAAQVTNTGNQETARQTETHSTLTLNINRQTEEVHRAIQATPSANTPLDADVADLLRHNDEQLCQLGVNCTTTSNSEPTTTRSPSNSAPTVRPLSVAPE